MLVAPVLDSPQRTDPTVRTFLEALSWTLGGAFAIDFAIRVALADRRRSYVLRHWYEIHPSSIVKPGVKVLLHQALVEHVTMRAAELAGVTVASTTMVQFEDQWAIVIERFDRLATAERVLRLHQEDFCQALGRLPGTKYESRGRPTLADMVKLVRREHDVTGRRCAGAGRLRRYQPDRRRSRRPFKERLFAHGTGLTYHRDVERTVAVSIGEERVFSRIRRKQWEKAARILDFDQSILLRRVATLAEAFPRAFREALAEMSNVPGAGQVAERTVLALGLHCSRLLDQWDMSALT